MSERTDAQLTTEAAVIRDETAVGGNTKTRVYNILKNIIDSKVNNENVHYRGLFTSLALLEAGVPVGNPGDYADVDEGADYPPTRYIWDESDLEWVAGSSAGSVASVTGTSVDNTDTANPVVNAVPTTLAGDTTILSGGFYLRVQGVGVEEPQIILDAPNNVRKSLTYRTGNLDRWQVHIENNETGVANAGSDFHIERYDDAGSQIDAPFGINRTDGVAFFNKAPVITTAPAAAANNTEVPTTAWVQTEITPKAPLASPALTGTPTVPTAAPGTNTTQAASTAFVMTSSPKIYPFWVTDETTPIGAGTTKITFRIPYAMTLTSVRCSLVTSQTSGLIFTVDINVNGASILSTKLTIDNTEKTSTTAATPPVISSPSISDDAEITIDVDQIGSGTAAGLKCVLIGY